jgi:hypothetical protein
MTHALTPKAEQHANETEHDDGVLCFETLQNHHITQNRKVPKWHTQYDDFLPSFPTGSTATCLCGLRPPIDRNGAPVDLVLFFCGRLIYGNGRF